MDDFRARLAAGSEIALTDAGPVEFAAEGNGETVLMIHGAGGGYDQGLFVGRETFGSGCRIIAPSRFGYLRTPIPDDASPPAQADAHAALLDALGVECCVVAGVSAGAPSAIELALRHPDRVAALILLVPRCYDPDQMVGVEDRPSNRLVLRLIERASDFGYWTGLRLARSSLVRFLGVPPALEARAPPEERDRITALMRSILPLSRRVAGLRVDGATMLAEWPLDRINVPTLIVSAKDDLFHTLPGARFTAERIKGAELKILDDGGHLMLGRGPEVRDTVATFLDANSAHSAGPRDERFGSAAHSAASELQAKTDRSAGRRRPVRPAARRIPA